MTLATLRPAAHHSRRSARAVDPRVVAANRVAAQLLIEEAERSSSRIFKLLVRIVSVALSLAIWWIAIKLTLRL